MKTQTQAILEDLIEFLKENGMRSELVEDQVCLRIDVIFEVTDPYDVRVLFFNVCDNSIYTTAQISIEVVSLADPQYREKFMKHCLERLECINRRKHKVI